MRNGITTLDMSVLLDDNRAKGKEQKKLPAIEKDEEKDFFQYEKPKEAEKPASFGSYRDRARQKISDSTAEKAGVEEDVFEKIERDWQEYRAKEIAREEKDSDGFGNDFLSYFDEQKSPNEYITNKQAGGKIAIPSRGYGSRNEWYEQSSDDYKDRYDAANEYVMSTGNNAFENTVKGFFNNFRSTAGEMVENGAYMLYDYAPWYKPARQVISYNTAGQIGAKAEEQFNRAREKSGEIGNKIIDAADSFSESMGYSLFGLNAGTYLEVAGESFDEYRKLRESGYSEEEAFGIASEKAMIAVLSAKADDYVGKNNPVDDVLYGKNGLVDKFDDINYNYATIMERLSNGEISTKILGGKQRKHIEGTKEYLDKYKDGSNPQSILTISTDEAQKLVNKYAGTGIPGKKDKSGEWTEFVSADFTVGKCFSKGQYCDTNRFAIHYSKKGAHIVPVCPRKEK